MPREEEKIIIEEITALRREVIEFKTMYKELQESYDELHEKVDFVVMFY